MPTGWLTQPLGSKPEDSGGNQTTSRTGLEPRLVCRALIAAVTGHLLCACRSSTASACQSGRRSGVAANIAESGPRRGQGSKWQNRCVPWRIAWAGVLWGAWPAFLVFSLEKMVTVRDTRSEIGRDDPFNEGQFKPLQCVSTFCARPLFS